MCSKKIQLSRIVFFILFNEFIAIGGPGNWGNRKKTCNYQKLGDSLMNIEFKSQFEKKNGNHRSEKYEDSNLKHVWLVRQMILKFLLNQIIQSHYQTIQ